MYPRTEFYEQVKERLIRYALAAEASGAETF